MLVHHYDLGAADDNSNENALALPSLAFAPVILVGGHLELRPFAEADSLVGPSITCHCLV